MFIKYLKVVVVFSITSTFTIGVINATNDKKDKTSNDVEKKELATPLVTWNGKDLTVEASEIIDRVVISGELHEVADSVAVISLNPNSGVVDITVETGSGDYDCEVDTGMDGQETGEQD